VLGGACCRDLYQRDLSDADNVADRGIKQGADLGCALLQEIAFDQSA